MSENHIYKGGYGGGRGEGMPLEFSNPRKVGWGQKKIDVTLKIVVKKFVYIKTIRIFDSMFNN